ncbi:hypothetical protein QT995_05300 [Microcoleus sp. S36b_A3]
MGWEGNERAIEQTYQAGSAMHSINFNQKEAMNEEIAGKITAYRRGK